MRFLCLLIIVSASLSPGFSRESDSLSKSSGDKDSFSVSEGRRFFAQYCSSCYGDNGDGLDKYLGYELNPQPPDFTSPDFLQDRIDSLLRTAVTEGSAALGKSNLCPPWGNTLHTTEIEFLVAYIKKTNEMANNDSEPDQEHNEKNNRGIFPIVLEDYKEFISIDGEEIYLSNDDRKNDTVRYVPNRRRK